MLQDISLVSDAKIIAPVRNASNRCERPLGEARKLRNRWPFTVTAGYGSMPSADAGLLGHTDTGSFVT